MSERRHDDRDQHTDVAATARVARDAPAMGRLWFYSNYHCNLACGYCLTDSSPTSPRRHLERDVVEALAADAVELGFTSFGITGGEPFLRPDMPELVRSLGRILPTIVLTNGTLFTARTVASMSALAMLPVALQISIDSDDPAINDAGRGPENFARASAGIERLRAAGIAIRIGTTVDGSDAAGLERLCRWHRSLGISDDDHVVRPIVARGRARARGLGIETTLDQLPAELTIAADGSFWSPAGPTVSAGRLDTEYVLTRTIRPLAIPLAAMRRYAGLRTAYEPALRVT